MIDSAVMDAETAAKSLQVANRPWIRITHRIVRPLDFTFVGAAGPDASITFEDTLESVGQTVALNVFSWEDIIPMDANLSYKTALARQSKWCDSTETPSKPEVSEPPCSHMCQLYRIPARTL